MLMGNVLIYKGYHAQIKYDAENKVLYGKIDGIDDLITFESGSIQDVERQFHLAVDDYLEYRKKIDKILATWGEL